MAQSSETVEFEGVKVAMETTAALLVEIEGKKHWIPKSLIHEDSEVYKKGTEGTLVIPEWFATKEGLV